jgi:hypothetical protein
VFDATCLQGVLMATKSGKRLSGIHAVSVARILSEGSARGPAAMLGYIRALPTADR